MTTNDEIADRLWTAREQGTPCAPPSESAELDVEDAYAIQRINIDRRLDGEGHHGRAARLVGHKIGLTSDAIQEWLDVDEPDFGHLLDDMVAEEGGDLPTDGLLQARAEAEVAFVLDEPLAGPGVTSVDVLRATADNVISAFR